MMMTAQERKDLSSNYTSMAHSLVDQRKTHPLETDAERIQFDSRLGDLLKAADDLMNQSVEQASIDIGTSVQALQHTTKTAADALSRVDTMAKALAIAAAAIGLGAAILNPTPASVAGALGTLAEAVQKATAKPAAAAGAGS
jgi:myo-inositol-1-phosphate synthase